MSVTGSPECSFSTGTNSGVPCDSTHVTVGQFGGGGNILPDPLLARRGAGLLEENADPTDEPVVVPLEQNAFGPPGGGAVDLESLGQFDERHAGVDVRHAL